MARLRSEFHFGLKDLLVAREALGGTAEFERDGYLIRVRIPANEKEFFPRFDELLAIGGGWSGIVGDPKQRVNILILQVAIIGDAPFSASDFDKPERERPSERAVEHLRQTFSIAQAVASELIDWVRIRGQVWLGLHGDRPERVGIDSLIDEETGRRIPVGFSHLIVHVSSSESAIDPAFVSELHKLLGDARKPIPTAETLLADALHFARADPPDLQRAVLLAAIACEVKVKETLRKQATPEKVALVDLILENPRDWSLAAISLFDKPMSAVTGHSLKTENPPLYKQIDRLFSVRNRIAHKGEMPPEGDAEKVVIAARDAFEWLGGLTN